MFDHVERRNHIERAPYRKMAAIGLKEAHTAQPTPSASDRVEQRVAAGQRQRRPTLPQAFEDVAGPAADFEHAPRVRKIRRQRPQDEIAPRPEPEVLGLGSPKRLPLIVGVALYVARDHSALTASPTPVRP